ncbi:MAG: hypothetical protein IPL52_11850 [Flavobacteriales bacterium]|nr:hypothetical protein [Flavobacteriales bacterium]
MWIETDGELQGRSIVKYFDGRIIHVDGKEYTIRAYMGGMVTVDGISHYGVTSQQDADEMTAIGFELYGLLRNAPAFRYAITGVEVDGSVTLSELYEDPEYWLGYKGFVIRKDIYQKTGSTRPMAQFGTDYVWTPYEGERWSNSKEPDASEAEG